MLINKKQYHTVWMEDSGSIYMINQLLLPHKFILYRSGNYKDTAKTIRNMIVRGAPAIAATGAYGVAQAALFSEDKDLERTILDTEQLLKNTRPTAVELFHAVDLMKEKILTEIDRKLVRYHAIEYARSYANESIEKCKRIGEYGEQLLGDGCSILTHCNAGALACVDIGTALAPIRLAHSK